MRDGDRGILESQAFRMIARRHRADGLHLIAKIDGDGREPNRAWIECDHCTGVVELAGGSEWAIVGEENESVIRPECGVHLGAAQA
ncbi:MAG: hypothetical protein ACYDC3_20625 [Candidatus Binataceae bacterium]